MNFIQFKNSIDNELNKENVVAVQQENVAVKQEIPVVNEGNMANKRKQPIPYEQFVEYDRLTEEKLQKLRWRNERLEESAKLLEFKTCCKIMDLEKENEKLKKENEKLKQEFQNHKKWLQ